MEKLISHTYHVSGMTCGGCATTVKNKLSAFDGVTSLNVDLAKNEVEITSLKAISADRLQQALSNTHYTIAEPRTV